MADHSGPAAAAPISQRRLFWPLALLLLLLCGWLSRWGGTFISVVYFQRQDVWAALALAALFLLFGLWLPRVRWAWPRLSNGRVLAAAAVLTLLLWAGTYALMRDYALTRDEHMVLFDGWIYAHGRLSQPVPPGWQGFQTALVPAFLLDIPGLPIFVSAYLPGNAMLRAAFGQIADPALFNPLLAGIGLIALYRIGRRLFADSEGAQWTALLLYALSAQVLVAAMTSYAMTAHLTLDLIWLALFLRGGRLGHGGALLTGFVATGLHQLIFHPLFAGPFILALAVRRRWRLFGLYSLGYAAMLAFWVSYPHLVAAAAGIAPSVGGAATTGGFFAERVLPLIVRHDPATFILMGYNSVRFATWQSAAMLPLLVLAFGAIRRGEGIAIELAAGLLLTFLAMLFLLPYQGHGWGYRYVHGLIGSVALLGGYAYRGWAQRDRAKADGLVLTGSGVTLALFLPWCLVQAHLFISPYASLDALIGRQRADFALIDTEVPMSAVDQARNLPDLGNRPLRFSSRHMSPAEIEELCRRGTVTLIGRRQFHWAGFVPELPEPSPRFAAKVAGIADQPCIRPPVR